MKLLVLIFLAACSFHLVTTMAIADGGGADADDPCAGPAVEADLQDLPPIDDQGKSPWCATYGTKAVLDYNIHEECLKSKTPDACAYSATTRVSAVDMNSLSSLNDPSTRGKNFNLADGDNPQTLLEGVQKDGVLSDEALPVDQALFYNSPGQLAILTRLTQYYTAEKERVAQVSAGQCSSPNAFAELEGQFSGITQVADAVISSAPPEAEESRLFLNQVSKKYYPISSDLQMKRKPMVPAFNIVHFTTEDDSEYKSHILKTLQDHQPITTGVCMDQLKNRVVTNPVPLDPKSCAPHALTIVGFRKTSDGKCQIHLRNSWGARFGNGKPPDGTMWVSTEAYMQSRVPASGKWVNQAYSRDLVSIKPRRPDQPVMNVDQNNERTFTGSTWGGGFLHGKSKENDGMVGSEEGTFDPKTDELIRGRSVDPFGDLSVGSFKEGEIDCGITKSQSGMHCVLHGKQTGPASSMDPKSCGCVGE